MRRARSFALVVLFAFLAVGCGRTEPTAERPLTVGLTEPGYHAGGVNFVGYDLGITETLVALGPDFELQPGLAERWQLIPPNTWRFSLRAGVRFHDGKALDAAAVKAGLFDRIALLGGGTIAAGPDSAKVVDEHTIDFTSMAPSLPVPERLTHPFYGVTTPGSDPETTVGTGPFRLVDYVPEQRLVVERNDDYWGAKAKSDRVTFSFYGRTDTPSSLLEAGQVDIATQLRPTDAKALEGPDVRIVTSATGSYDALYANIHKPDGILGDQVVRQAVAHAIDREEIVTLLEGMATTDPTMVPPALLRPDDALVQGATYDQEKAKALLDQAGWRTTGTDIREMDGRRLQLVLVSGAPSSATFGPIPQYLAAALGKVGVAVEIRETPDVPSYFALVGSGEGDLYLEQGTQSDADVAFLPSLVFYSKSVAEEVNYAALFAAGATFDALIERSYGAEPPAARQAVAEAIDLLVDQEAVLIPLAGIVGIYGTKVGVTGFAPHPSSVHIRWADVGWDDAK